MSGDKLRRSYRFATVPEHLIRDKALSDRAVRLWCILDRYAGKDEESFPSRLTLADDLSCSRASVDRAVIELVDGGWLSKERREAGGTNLYTLLIAKASAARSKAQVSAPPVVTGDDTPDDRPVVTSDDTPLITGEDTPAAPVTTPVITGAAQKEESLSENDLSENTPASLRSAAPTESTGELALLPSAEGSADPDRRPAAGKSGGRRARQLPDDFTVTQGMRAWAAKELPHLDVDAETLQFCDHHRARGSVMKDWVAAWRTWMRNTRRFDRTTTTRRPIANRHGTDADAKQMFGGQWQ